jgi:hypothetical protein
MKDYPGIFVILLCIVVIFTAGCTTEQDISTREMPTPVITTPESTLVPTTTVITPTPTPSPTTMQPTVAVTKISTPKPTEPLAPVVVINSTGYSSWSAYTRGGFTIYKPSEWMQRTTTSDYVIDAPPPNYGFIFISPVYLSNVTYDDEDKTRISDATLDAFILSQIKLADSSRLYRVRVPPSEKDSRYYLINGNPARHFILHLYNQGDNSDQDAYLVTHGNQYYYLAYTGWAGTIGIEDGYRSTGLNILKTFTTNQIFTKTTILE